MNSASQSQIGFFGIWLCDALNPTLSDRLLGNAQRWAGGSSVADPDLFTEGVDFAETRGYIKAVYGFYATYRRLYQ